MLMASLLSSLTKRENQAVHISMTDSLLQRHKVLESFIDLLQTVGVDLSRVLLDIS